MNIRYPIYEGVYRILTDNLALAARARREADWILGVNASIALGIAAGMGNHSLGRVQTPTLALVCRRYLENRDFVPVSFYHLRTGVCKDGQKVLFTRPLRYERKEDAEKARAGLEGEKPLYGPCRGKEREYGGAASAA